MIALIIILSIWAVICGLISIKSFRNYVKATKSLKKRKKKAMRKKKK